MRAGGEKWALKGKNSNSGIISLYIDPDSSTLSQPAPTGGVSSSTAADVTVVQRGWPGSVDPHGGPCPPALKSILFYRLLMVPVAVFNGLMTA